MFSSHLSFSCNVDLGSAAVFHQSDARGHKLLKSTKLVVGFHEDIHNIRAPHSKTINGSKLITIVFLPFSCCFFVLVSA